MRRGILFIFALPVIARGIGHGRPGRARGKPALRAERHGERRRVTDRCPKGQEGPELAQVSSTSVSIIDTTSGIPAPVPGTFAACLLPAVRGARS